MLRLVKCEFWKLKRKKFVSFVVFAALLFPIPLTALVLKGQVGDVEAFDSLYAMLVCMGEPIMLPCILGIIAAMLFFMERDNQTMKNLQTIPLPTWKIASAKIIVLYIMGLIYTYVTLLSSMFGGIVAGSNVGNILSNSIISIITSILYTTSVLPVVIAIVWCKRSYIFAIILTFFYTMFGFVLAFTGQFTSTEPILKIITNIMPTPIIYRWQASQMIKAGTPAFLVWQPYFLPLWIVALTVFIIGLLSYLAIIKIYSRQEK